MRNLLCMVLALLLPLGAAAQRKGRPAKKAKVEEPAEDPRITQMRASTQRVVFIDSLVVSRADFMDHIPLSASCGKVGQQMGLGSCTNELGDHRLVAQRQDATDTLTAIFSQDFIANAWTAPQALSELGAGGANYPFLMPDGTTLYYAQRGEGSIGGYDLFVTRYDSERHTFLRPENLGMPFASEANDLFYAIDEEQQLGYFVTDRRQQPGQVCIYIFIPPQKRSTYPTEAYSPEQLAQLAAIGAIADTWGDGQERQAALKRLEQARDTFNLPLDPRSLARREPSTSLAALRHQADVLDKALTLARNYYATATDDERQKLRGEIVESERQLEALLTEIRQKEKAGEN